MSKLPFSLTPEPNESVQGFIARLAAENCCISISELLSSGKLSPGQHANFKKTGSYKCIVSLLNMLSDDDCTEAKNYFEQQAKQYKLSPLLKSAARYCPVCLEQNTIQDIEWQISLKTHCTKHRVAILDTCYSCGTALTFESIHANACSFCSSKLTDVDKEMTGVPEYLSGLTELKGKALKDAASELLNAAGRLLRPFDMIAGKSEHLETFTTTERIEILTAAHELMTKPSARQLYASEISGARQKISVLGNHAVAFPSTSFNVNDTLQDDSPCKTISFTQWNTDKAIANKVRNTLVKKENAIDDDCIKYLADLWIVNKVVGTTCDELGSLVGEGIISPVKIAKSLSGMLFDVSDFAAQLKKLPPAAYNDELVSLSEVRNNLFFEQCCSSLGELMKDSEIQAYRVTQEPGFLTLCWKRSELEAWGKKTFGQKNVYISAKIAKLILKIEQSELNTLVDQGKIRRCKTNSHFNKEWCKSYKSQDVLALLKK